MGRLYQSKDFTLNRNQMLTLHLLLEIEAVQEKNDILHAEVMKKLGGRHFHFFISQSSVEMDMFTSLFFLSFFLFVVLSMYLVCCTKKTPIFYAQIASGLGMFVTSKIGRKFLGLE
jgi:hypothetical protein